MKKLLVSILLCALMCTVLLLGAAADEGKPYGYYDTNCDGYVELSDALAQLKALVNGEREDINLIRVLRVLKAVVAAEAVEGKITAIDPDTAAATFTVADIEGEYTLPLSALGLNATANTDAYVGAALVLSVPTPVADFFAAYGAAKVYAAAVDKDSLPSNTLTTRVTDTFINQETGELYVYTDLFEDEIPASALGITTYMPKIAYLGLPLTLTVNCDADAFSELYPDGKASILACEIPAYTEVENIYEGTIATETRYDEALDADVYLLRLDLEEFSSAEYDITVYACGDIGWAVTDSIYILDAFMRESDGSYLDPEIALGSLSYRTVENGDGKKGLELLYMPYHFGKYVVRELTSEETGETDTYTLVAEYVGWETTNIDGEKSEFEEMYLGTSLPVESRLVPAGSGEQSRTVTVWGEPIADGEFMYYSYNRLDNELNVEKNVGTMHTGKLTATGYTRQSLQIGETEYVYSPNTLSEYDYYSVMEMLEVEDPQYDNVQYLLFEDELMYTNAYTDPALKPSYDYAIVSFDEAILAELLGIDVDTYWEKTAGGYYLENDMVVAAFLNTASGAWEKGYIEGVALDYDADTMTFTAYCDLPKLAYYSAISTLSGEYTDLFARARTALQFPIAIVVSETDGAYVLADGNTVDDMGTHLLSRGENADGLFFTADGVTNAITAEPYGQATEIRTTEDTLLVLVNSTGAVGIRRGVQDESVSVYGYAEFFAASEDLILFTTEITDAYAWSGVYISDGSETYYTVLPDSLFEIERDDAENYVLRLTDLFDHKTNTVTDYEYTTADEDEAYDVYMTLAYAAAGNILYADGTGIVYADDDHGAVLTEQYKDSVYIAPYEILFAEDGSISVEVESMLLDYVGEYVNVPISSIEVISLDLTTYDKAAYDFSAYLGGETVTAITKETAGVLDATICAAAQTTGATVSATDGSGNTAEIRIDLNTVMLYDETTETATLKIIKVITGGESEEDPAPEAFPQDPVAVPEVGFVILATDATTVAPLLGLTEAEYSAALISDCYVEQDRIVVAILNTDTGAWEKGYIESVALDFNLRQGFYSLCDLPSLAKYREIVTLSAEYENKYLAASAVLNSGIAVAVKNSDGSYVLADIEYGYDTAAVSGSEDGETVSEWCYLVDRYTSESADGLTFTDGKTNPIKATADASVEAATVTLTEDTVTVAIGYDGTVGVRRGILTAENNITEAETVFFAADRGLIVLRTTADVAAWAGIGDGDGETKPPVDPEYPAAPTFGYAVITTNDEIMAELLDIPYDDYAGYTADGYYLENGMVVCAVLNTETGAWEKGYIDAVAYAYDPLTADFAVYADLAKLAGYAAIVPLAEAYMQQYTNAQTALWESPVLVVAQTDNVYTIANIHTASSTATDTATAANFFADRWTDPDMTGLVFDASGKTNPIKATADATVEAAAVQTTDDTVIVVCSPFGVEVRTGVQTAANSLEGIDATYYCAGEDLILLYTAANCYGWGSKDLAAKYYLPLPETTVELSATDEDGVYAFTFENVIDLSALTAVESVTCHGALGDAYDLFYALDIGFDGVLRLDENGVEAEWISIDAAMVQANDGYAAAELYTLIDDKTIEIRIDGEEPVEFTKEDTLAGISLAVTAVDLSGIRWTRYDTDTMYFGDAVYAEGVYANAETVTPEEGGDTYYRCVLPAEGSTTVAAPTAGVLSQFELDMADDGIYAKNAKGDYAYLCRMRLYTVASYDAESNSVSVRVLKTIEE